MDDTPNENELDLLSDEEKLPVNMTGSFLMFVI